MPLTFYPHTDDAQKGSYEERVEVLMEAAERYKAIVLDVSAKPTEQEERKRMVPREQTAAFNWEEIARLLREIRELPEGNKSDKLKKAVLLKKISGSL